jgi:phosphatidylserine/phosphatidylglycerophosphate/cardiolipin synthase-like enzyme
LADEQDTAEDEARFDDKSVEPGVWRYARASRASVIVDAADYFALVQQAMLKAQRRIMLIAWDFDTRIHLAQGRRWWQRRWRREPPTRLGSFILWLGRHRPELEIRILKWGLGFLKFFGRGSMLLDLARWWPHDRIDFKFDTHHPVGCSHHQKIAVIDDRLAVCGGIDMTTERWDTREHREDDAHRKSPRGRRYRPWHDATMMLEGDVAGALGEFGRDRWRRAGGRPLEPVEWDGDSAWPDVLEAQFTNVEVGIARTRAEYCGEDGVDEIARLFERQIARAKKFIYAESQYFASRIVAEAICKRLAEDDPPEIVIVHAETAEGFVEQQAMDTARVRLVTGLREMDKHSRLHFYVPYTGETPIYCHAKIMIVDDEFLRIGSANFNNRSMGLDSECDVFIDCARPANGHCGEAIRSIRHSLLAEHLGLEESEIPPLLDKHGAMAAMIAALGDDRPRSLRPLEVRPLTEIERTMADGEVLDPETPKEMFDFLQARRGLFRRRGLLSRAMARRRRKQGTR